MSHSSSAGKLQQRRAAPQPLRHSCSDIARELLRTGQMLGGILPWRSLALFGGRCRERRSSERDSQPLASELSVELGGCPGASCCTGASSAGTAAGINPGPASGTANRRLPLVAIATHNNMSIAWKTTLRIVEPVRRIGGTSEKRAHSLKRISSVHSGYSMILDLSQIDNIGSQIC